MRELRVRVTMHAMERWRERIDPDGHPRDIVAAMRAAQPVPDGDGIPLVRKVPGYRYFRSGDVYFAAEPLGPDEVRVVTVMPLVAPAPPPPTARQRAVALMEKRSALLREMAELQEALKGFGCDKSHPARALAAARFGQVTAELGVIKKALYGLPRPKARQ